MKKEENLKKKRKLKIGIYFCKDLYVYYRFERLIYYIIVLNIL